jgi:threonine/homoserine/homoserine lactone efflux protein
MVESLSFLTSGILFGLVAGIAPGPLLTLVISETLRHSRKEGIIVASVPVVTDLPIVLVSILVLAQLSKSNFILGIISLLGAFFILYLAYESISVKGLDLNLPHVDAQSFRKGIITNFLNPHPYVFWMTVGAPIILKAYKVNLLSAVLYVGGFYVFLVGSKMIVALLVDQSKRFLESRVYIHLIRALGVALLIFSLVFFKDGLEFLGVI